MSTTTRRDALKYIGIGFGGVAIAPAVLLQACKEAATNPSYSYSTLSPTQATTLRIIQDTILPKTDTPSASELGSVQFADTYLTYGFKPDDKAKMLYQLDRFAAKLKEEHGADMEGATPEQINAMFTTYFVNYKAPESTELSMEIEGNKIKQGNLIDSLDNAEGSRNLNAPERTEEAVKYRDDEFELNDMLTSLRWMTLESFYQSEQMGEEVFNYMEVPGKWNGQLPISELPKPGIAWSL